MRRTSKSACLLYLFYETIIGMYLNWHESLAEDNALHNITRYYLAKQLDWWFFAIGIYKAMDQQAAEPVEPI